MNRRQATVCPPGKKKRVTTTVRSPTPTIDDHKYETTVTPSPSRFSTNSTQTMISADRSGRIRHSIPSEDVLREEDNNRAPHMSHKLTTFCPPVVLDRRLVLNEPEASHCLSIGSCTHGVPNMSYLYFLVCMRILGILCDCYSLYIQTQLHSS
jgi:hypothetical protein